MKIELHSVVDRDWLVEAVARRVVELLDERQSNMLEPAVAHGQLVDASTLAGLLMVSRSTIYEHAVELGALEVGDGERPRLRFDVEKARAAWTARSSGERSDAAEAPVETRAPRRRRRAAARSSEGLLPVLGSAPATDAESEAA